MSKELEALERFNNVAYAYDEWLYDCSELYRRNIERRINLRSIDKDYNLLKQALKRNEPMKVDLVPIATLLIYDYYDCPKCGGKVIGNYYNYCPYCGQKLDWKE